MSYLRPLALLIPLLLVACDKPGDPIEPIASRPAANSSADTATDAVTTAATTPASGTPVAIDPVPPSLPAELSARVVLMPTSGQTANGDLSLHSEQGALRLTGTITGLTAETVHGFHVHERGDCSAPDASSAGEHFNPSGEAHGEPGTATHHLGDLPNITADAEGKAAVNLRLPDLELGSNGPRDALGRALVLHAQRDDYRTQPAGDSGARIACGVIQRATQVAGTVPPLPSDPGTAAREAAPPRS
jgi:Cu-Zn family superoxide dismutase